jgi:hypothetical protein
LEAVKHDLIRFNTEDNDSIGLTNVNDRIRIIYGW